MHDMQDDIYSFSFLGPVTKLLKSIAKKYYYGNNNNVSPYSNSGM